MATANTASTNAASAVTTANTAVTTANTAKTTADTAKTTADSALALAQSNKTRLDTLEATVAALPRWWSGSGTTASGVLTLAIPAGTFAAVSFAQVSIVQADNGTLYSAIVTALSTTSVSVALRYFNSGVLGLVAPSAPMAGAVAVRVAVMGTKGT